MADRRRASRAKPWLRLAVGVGLTAFAVLLAAAPWPFSLSALAPAATAHAAVFDWSLRRPSALPGVGAFAIGLLLDVISGPIFGLGALTCVLAHFSAAAQRRFLAPRGVGHAWLGLALTAVAIAAFGWIAASAYMVAIQPVGPTLAQAALTIALYPPIAIAFGLVRAGFDLGARRA